MPTTEPSGLSDQPDRLGEYRLKVWQQPVLARLCSYKEENDTIDRRPVDPPPVVELQSLNTSLRELVESTSFFIRVSIVHPTPAQNGEYDIVRTPTGAEASTGEVIQTPERLNGLDGKPGAVVIFAKLSVRMPGVFRMKFTLYETSDFGITQITYTISDTFEVFSPKLFKGMKASTPLTRHLAAQGMKVKLRTDTTVGRQGTSRRRSGNISAPATRSNSPQAARITSPDQRSTGPRQTYNQPNVPLSLHTVRPLPTHQQRNVTVNAPPTVPARDRQLVWRPPMNRLVFNPLDGFDQDPGNTSNFSDDGLMRPIRDFPMRSDPLPTPPSADLSAFSLSNNSRRNSSHSNSRSDGIPPTLPYPGDRLNLRLGDDGIPTLPPIFSLPPLAMQSHPHTSSRLSNVMIFPSPILPPIQNYPLEDKNM